MHELFKKRHSIRRFRATEIDKHKLKEILKVAHSSPSAGNLKARELCIVRDEQTKKSLVKAAYFQFFIAQAPVVLVFFAVPSRSSINYGHRGRELYSIQDATIAASYAWLEAVSQGLSAVWVGGFINKKIVEILNVDRLWKPVVIMPIGYKK